MRNSWFIKFNAREEVMAERYKALVNVLSSAKGRDFEFRSTPEKNWIIKSLFQAQKMIAVKPRQSKKISKRA